MLYIKTTKKLSKEDILIKIKIFENKYGLALDDFEKKVVNGNEQELDEKGIYPEYEEWKYYSDALKKKEIPVIEESSIRPLKPMKPALEVFTEKRLSLLEVLNDRKVDSITQLSRIVKRDRGSVYADLQILKQINLVTLRKEGKLVVPSANVSSIAIEL